MGDAIWAEKGDGGRIDDSTIVPFDLPGDPAGSGEKRLAEFVPDVRRSAFLRPTPTPTPAALLGFEEKMAENAEPVVDDIAKKLGSSDGPVHADETYWTLDGERAYFWVHADD